MHCRLKRNFPNDEIILNSINKISPIFWTESERFALFAGISWRHGPPDRVEKVPVLSEPGPEQREAAVADIQSACDSKSADLIMVTLKSWCLKFTIRK